MNSLPLNAKNEESIILLPEQEQQVAVISHMASYSDMLVAVCGEPGSGKSILAFELLRQHPNVHDTLLITADIMFGIPSLLRRIADVDQLVLPENRSQAIDVLKQAAETRASEESTLLVVIDQAEQLDVDTLNEIAHLALLIPKGLSFVLFGTTGFSANFRQGPAQAAVHQEIIKPLSEEGARQLLQNIFSPGQALPLNETEFIYIYRQSAGNPATLIAQAGEYFISAAEAPARKQGKAPESKLALTEKFPLMHLVALALLVLALVFSYLYQPRPEQNTEALEKAVVVEDVLNGLPLPKEKEQPVIELDTPEIMTIDSENIDFNYAEPGTIDIVEEKTVEVELKADPEPIKKATVNAKKEEKLSDKQALLKLKSGAIIQLFGSYSQDNATKFKQDWQGKINKQFYQYQTTNNGKPWHVVVVGVYTDRAQAQQDIQKWPAKLKAEKPWVRDIKAVQQSL